MELTYLFSTTKSLLFSVNLLFSIYYFSQFQIHDLIPPFFHLNLYESLISFPGILIVTGCYSYLSEEGR